MLIRENCLENAWVEREEKEGFDGIVNSPLEFVSKFARAVLDAGELLSSEACLYVEIDNVGETVDGSTSYDVNCVVRLWHPDVVEMSQVLMSQYLIYCGETFGYNTISMYACELGKVVFECSENFDEGYTDILVRYSGKATNVHKGYFTGNCLEELRGRMKSYEFD